MAINIHGYKKIEMHWNRYVCKQSQFCTVEFMSLNLQKKSID